MKYYSFHGRILHWICAGEWKSDQRNGYGIYSWADGRYFEVGDVIEVNFEFNSIDRAIMSTIRERVVSSTSSMGRCTTVNTKMPRDTGTAMHLCQIDTNFRVGTFTWPDGGNTSSDFENNRVF